MLNPDYKDMLSALCAEKVDFVLVGAYAMAAHGLPRATGDMDVLIGADGMNSGRVFHALERFGAPMEGLAPDSFAKPGLVYQIGVSPSRIDLMTSIEGIEFAQVWKNRLTVTLEGLEIPVISIEDLILNKSAVGRAKDLADLEWLRDRKTN